MLAGDITVSIRLWSRAKVRVGGRYRVQAGEIHVDAIDIVPFSAVTDDDAMRALALNVGYLVGGAPIFVAKFLVFDRIFFAGRPALRSVGGGQLDEGARGEARRPSDSRR